MRAKSHSLRKYWSPWSTDEFFSPVIILSSPSEKGEHIQQRGRIVFLSAKYFPYCLNSADSKLTLARCIFSQIVKGLQHKGLNGWKWTLRITVCPVDSCTICAFCIEFKIQIKGQKAVELGEMRLSSKVNKMMMATQSLKFVDTLPRALCTSIPLDIPQKYTDISNKVPPCFSSYCICHKSNGQLSHCHNVEKYL